MKFVTSPVSKVSKYLDIKENSTPSLYYFILYINKLHKMCIHKGTHCIRQNSDNETLLVHTSITARVQR